ncbi:hypothetical protein [Leucobacter luti]|uniref:hypothetical protein n=1 Tax=Leucobacter luti TaxID=340320 RepID=UPI003D08EA24
MRTITIENAGDVELTVQLAMHAVGEGLAQVAMLRVTPIVAAGECVAGLSGTLTPIADFRHEDVGGLEAGDTRMMCLEVSVPQGADPALSGESISFALALNGAQVSDT